jgi:glycosyltransferase involved in cell wall biosynthesis
MRRLRLLHLVSNRWWTGSGDPALDLARALRDRGHDVRFACIQGDALEARARKAGLAPVPSLSLERTARPWTVLGDVRAIRRLVREHGIEIVHAHQGHDHWLAAAALRGSPARLVRTVHHRRALHRGPALRWLLATTDAVIASSQAIATLARARGVGAGRLAVVGGGIQAERFPVDADGGAVRAELGLGAAPVVGCVARLVPGRGHDLLLRAAVPLRARIAELRVLLVGRGEGRPAVERLARGLGLGAVVAFAGYRGEDLPQALAAIDCFVLLGAGSEESCRAVLEAMAMARPVVAARVGALPETVADGETGFLVEEDPEAVAERVAALLADPVRARAMGLAGRQRVLQGFTSEHRAARIEEIYARLLRGAASHRATILAP